MLGTLTTRHTRFCRRLGVEATGTDQIFPQLKRSLALLGVATLPLGPGTFIDTGNYTGRLADHFPEHTPRQLLSGCCMRLDYLHIYECLSSRCTGMRSVQFKGPISRVCNTIQRLRVR